MLRRRIVHAFAVAAALAGLASGCSDAEDRPTLTVQTLAAPGSDHYRLLEAALAEFGKDHPDIETRLVGDRLKLDYLMRSVVARQSADVIEVRAGEVAFLAARGALTDVTPHCLDVYRECAALPWGWGTVKERFYAVPWAALPTLLLYNKQAFREAEEAFRKAKTRDGVSAEERDQLLVAARRLKADVPPETWDELLLAARLLTRNVEGEDGSKRPVYGFALAGKNSVDLGRHFATFMAQLGRPLLANEKGQLAFRMDTEPGRRATRFLLDLQKVAPPECVVTDNAAALEQFRAGRAAMVLASPAGLAPGKDHDKPFDIGVAPVPRPADGITVSDVSFRYLCVPAFVPEGRRAVAVKFAAFMAGHNAQEILARGIDGCVTSISIRREFLEGDLYAHDPRLQAFARAIRRTGPLFPSLIWQGKCSKDWLGWIHSVLVDDRRTADAVAVIAQRKGNQALSCLYTTIGHPTLTMKLGMLTVGMIVFIAVAYVVARR